MSEFIQLHFLTSYPPSNLNRDDLGRPKTAVMGGTQRLRISSQSLKRAWRTSDPFQEALDGQVGKRTRDVGNYVFERLAPKVEEAKAHACARAVAKVFGSVEGGDDDKGKAKKAKAKKGGEAAEAGASSDADMKARRTGQLVHVSVAEWKNIDRLIGKIAEGYEPSEADYKALLGNGHGTADIALFGRMLADAPDHNVEAAAQVAHAISVHAVTVEDDFFTAVDDLKKREEDLGAGHMGTTEFAAALFYTYVCVNRTLLERSLDGKPELVSAALRGLVEAAATVSPSGKQNSFGSRAYASYVLAERGDRQPRSLSTAFLKAVRDEDFLAASVAALRSTRDQLDRVYGACARERCELDATKGTGSLEELLSFVAK